MELTISINQKDSVAMNRFIEKYIIVPDVIITIKYRIFKKLKDKPSFKVEYTHRLTPKIIKPNPCGSNPSAMM
jgi:hypothetical protein